MFYENEERVMFIHTTINAFQQPHYLQIFKRRNLVVGVNFKRTKVISTDIVDDSKTAMVFPSETCSKSNGMEMEPGTTQPT